MTKRFKQLNKLCITCKMKLEENKKLIEEWLDNESNLYCPNCKEWKTGALVDWGVENDKY